MGCQRGEGVLVEITLAQVEAHPEVETPQSHGLVAYIPPLKRSARSLDRRRREMSLLAFCLKPGSQQANAVEITRSVQLIEVLRVLLNCVDVSKLLKAKPRPFIG